MSTLSVHPLTLRFASDYIEAAFRVEYARRSLLLVRWALTLGLMQYAGFGLLDRWLVPSSLTEVRLVRLGACLALAVGIAYTFAPSFLKRMQTVLAVVPLVGGLGVVAMVAVAQTADGYYQYYVGLTLILIYVHVLLRLRFVVASAVGGILIGAYLLVAVWQQTPPYLLANNVFFLLSANLSGMVASYALERYARLGFAQSRRQAQNNAILSEALGKLQATQTQLVQQEKMAGLGRLTSGIAHEIKNPLNFVTNFSALSLELIDELQDTVAHSDASGPSGDEAAIRDLIMDLRDNVTRIEEHGRRADGIVQSMLAHARPTSGERHSVELASLVKEYATIAHESFRVRHPECRGRLAFDLDTDVGSVVVAPQEIGRVVLNLVSNAFLAVCDRQAQDGSDYHPVVTVRVRREVRTACVEVIDNGVGIPLSVRDRIFEPFFTTRPAGQGTGLGLSLSADIAVTHGGMLTAESQDSEDTVFRLTLPAPLPPSDRAAGLRTASDPHNLRSVPEPSGACRPERATKRGGGV